MATQLSVVIPIFNEEETLPELHRRLRDVLESLEISYEAILVDDGSQDGSSAILKKIAEEDPRFKAIRFSRNFGHQAALYAGLRRALGDAVILMDGDLQDPPEVIPQLIEEWRQGSDVVFAVRRNRKESLAKRLAYAWYYRFLSRLAYVPIPLDSGDFSLMSRRVADLLRNMPERNKFLRGLRSWVGFRQTAVEYDRDGRFAGSSKYTLAKLVRLALDGLIAYSYVPLKLSYLLGGIVALLSFALAFAYFLQRILSDQYIPQGFTTLAILVLFLGGIQLIALGLIGEYIGRIYDEVKRRPEYVEAEVIGFETEADVRHEPFSAGASFAGTR